MSIDVSGHEANRMQIHKFRETQVSQTWSSLTFSITRWFDTTTAGLATVPVSLVRAYPLAGKPFLVSSCCLPLVFIWHGGPVPFCHAEPPQLTQGCAHSQGTPPVYTEPLHPPIFQVFHYRHPSQPKWSKKEAAPTVTLKESCGYVERKAACIRLSVGMYVWKWWKDWEFPWEGMKPEE